MRLALAALVTVALTSILVADASVVGTIVMTEKTTLRRVEQVGAAFGDVEVVKTRLLARRGNTIGFGTLVCTFVEEKLRQCAGTYSLPTGRISVGGIIIDPYRYTFAVTGGTGIYDGATGAATVNDAPPLGERRVVLRIR